jgi:hypothetical protein
MQERRHFLGWMLAGSAGLAMPWHSASGDAPARDDDWLDDISRKKYRAFLDIRGFSTEGVPFHKATNLRTALTTAFGAAPVEVGIALGCGSNGLANVLSPDLWDEYKIGVMLADESFPPEAAKLRVDQRKWGELGADGVREVRALGVRVLACRNTIARWSRNFAAKSGETPEAVQAKILRGLHEGVEPVPAMVAAAVLAQARNLSYVAIG